MMMHSLISDSHMIQQPLDFGASRLRKDGVCMASVGGTKVCGVNTCLPLEPAGALLAPREETHSPRPVAHAREPPSKPPPLACLERCCLREEVEAVLATPPLEGASEL